MNLPWKQESTFLLTNDRSVDDAVATEFIERIGFASDCCDEDACCDKMNRDKHSYDFESYEYLQRCISVVEYEANDWKDSKCNCPYFFKTFLCRHVIFMAVLNTKVKIPLQYKGIPIDGKKRRGRVSKAKKVYKIQDDEMIERNKAKK